MREHTKRWLLSRMKASGSKKKYVQNGSFADDRHKKARLNIEYLPNNESVKSNHKFYNGKVNYGLLVRFLRTQIGKDWDVVYSETISRIPTKLLDYREMIFWFVANEVEFINGMLWDKKRQKFIWNESLNKEVRDSKHWRKYTLYEFYVDPLTNLLHHIQQKSYKNQNSLS